MKDREEEEKSRLKREREVRRGCREQVKSQEGQRGSHPTTIKERKRGLLPNQRERERGEKRCLASKRSKKKETEEQDEREREREGGPSVRGVAIRETGQMPMG